MSAHNDLEDVVRRVREIADRLASESLDAWRASTQLRDEVRKLEDLVSKVKRLEREAKGQ